jgi:CRP/FNR family transcriptional regulator, anaerobic regulatory protein
LPYHYSPYYSDHNGFLKVKEEQIAINKNNMNCTTCKNTECPIFKFCPPEQRALANKNKTNLIIKKNHQLIHESTEVQGIYFIYSGKVKVYKEGIVDHSSSQIIRLAKSGQVLGHRGFGHKLEYSISADTLEACGICFFNNDFYFNFLKTNPDLIFHFLMFYADELKTIEARLRNMAQLSAKAKVADALQMILTSFGIDSKNILKGSLSRVDISEIAGLSHGETIRILSNLEEENIIKKIGMGIKIENLNKLKKIATSYH